MPQTEKPLVICSPDPRSLDLIFTESARQVLFDRYEIVETTSPDAVVHLPPDVLTRARFILGQPPLDRPTLEKMVNLRAILNVESNLFNNMPYEVLFERGIHVVTTGQVFAMPVAEIGLGFALALARGIVDADIAFRNGEELWGGDGNRSARLLSGSNVGIIGFGDLGKALNRVLMGFNAQTSVFDPWMPPSILKDHGVKPASLDEVLSTSDFVFVVASVTSTHALQAGRAGNRVTHAFKTGLDQLIAGDQLPPIHFKGGRLERSTPCD